MPTVTFFGANDDPFGARPHQAKAAVHFRRPSDPRLRPGLLGLDRPALARRRRSRGRRRRRRQCAKRAFARRDRHFRSAGERLAAPQRRRGRRAQRTWAERMDAPHHLRRGFLKGGGINGDSSRTAPGFQALSARAGQGPAVGHGHPARRLFPGSGRAGPLSARSSRARRSTTASRSSRRSFPGREEEFYDYARNIEEACRHPDVLAVLKLHYLRWALFDIKGDTYFMYQGIFDTDFDKYTEDAVRSSRRPASTRCSRISRLPGGLEDEPAGVHPVRARAPSPELHGIWRISRTSRPRRSRRRCA